ncbi:TrmH family RNA methyltransferase [Thermogemmatispora sp.]|uniref:TrmH family RNA methyltransferase n=1 Tax=Thermogemmatispora sp. TaxID=1968838 RepID=UPI001D281BF5|nr:RNA methyltransferase [Thermogemmatispora sp.]MBX5448841.1 RNA methyltransferase [Thermogemmatispora sp.]
MQVISSPLNPRIARLRELHTPRGRRKHGLFLLEGPHLLKELLDRAVAPLEVYYQPELLGRTAEGQVLLQRLLSGAVERRALVQVSVRVIEALGEVQTSQGVIALLPLAACSYEQVATRRPAASRPALLILDRLADPGNLGTILRTALAADVAAVLLTPGCVDAFNPKVVRAAAGAHLALPLAEEVGWDEIARRVQEHCGRQQRVFLAEAGAPQLYYEQDLRRPFALIIGNEAHGPSAAARALATSSISIPLANGVESLNAAMATAILLYEAVRQQRQSSS